MWLVKEAIKAQHSALNDLQIQTLIRSTITKHCQISNTVFRSLSVLTSLHQHNLRSRLSFTAGMKSSRDLVGDEKRERVQQAVDKADPFNSGRAVVTDFGVKSAGTPFFISKTEMEVFVGRAQAKFSCKYPHLTPSRQNPDNKD